VEVSQDWKDAFTHLRLHFSLLLMPVFLFALSQVEIIHQTNTIILFFILPLLIYPASNIFNSYYDRDQGSVGGIKNPPPPNTKMLWLANMLDITALILAVSMNVEIMILCLLYIIASRLYSYKPIRLKAYPILGFLVIFIFQGAFTYYLTQIGSFGLDTSTQYPEEFCLEGNQLHKIVYAMLATSFQIGAIYPLTQYILRKPILIRFTYSLRFKLQS